MSTNRWGDRLVRYPPDLARRYRRSGLWGTRTIADELHAVATAYPQRETVVALDGRMTYRELGESTDVLAAGLAGSDWCQVIRCCSRSPTGSARSWPGTGSSRRDWCRSARSPRTAATRSARSAAG